MKMPKVNIKNLFLGLILVGSASFVNAQTTQTDSTNKQPISRCSQSGNPTIEGLKTN
jgi:hypothetical protein